MVASCWLFLNDLYYDSVVPRFLFKTGLTVLVHHVLEDRNIHISRWQKLKPHNVEWILTASLLTGFMCLRTEHANDFSDFINGWEFYGCQLLSDHASWQSID